MQNIQTVSTKDLRENLSEILEKVAVGKQTFAVYKFGRIKAVLTPPAMVSNTKVKKIDFRKLPALGMWKDRKDMQDAAAWVSRARIAQSKRKI